MVVTAPYSHRSGLDILTSPRFADAFGEFVGVLAGLPPYRAAAAKRTAPAHVVAPAAMNHWLTHELCVLRGWEWQPLTDGTHDGGPQLRSDFRKARIEVEVQFGNVARYAYDLCKMAIAVGLDHADVGLLVVPTRRFAALTGSNLATRERVVRELGLMRPSLQVPLVVLGIEPETWDVEGYPSERDAPRPRRRHGAQLALRFAP